jgi:c-di-GMP-binding flagellar brake protein YcgR
MEFPESSLDDYVPRAEIILTRSEVLDILQRLVLNRLFVTVNLPDSATPYNSTILEVDHQGGSFILDELYPEDGHRRLVENGALRVRARLQGAEVSFSSEMRDVGEEAGIAYYRVAAPESVRYRQRRRAFRVAADNLADIPVLLKLEGREEPISALLHDISAGGLSFWLAPDAGVWLSPLQRIPLCEVRVPGATPLLTELEVRNVRLDDVRREHIVGARFVTAEPQVRQRIGRIVAAFQREALRRRQQRA